MHSSNDRGGRSSSKTLQLCAQVHDALSYALGDSSDPVLMDLVLERVEPMQGEQHVLVVVQDPCHLRHVQRAHGPVRSLLARAYVLLETQDDGLCCGAGGAYAVLQPELAAAIRDRKADELRRAGADRGAIVASANPGCMLHLRQAGLDVRHPADLLAAALVKETNGR